MVRLSVRNLGPLKNCEIYLKKINIFIGPQGSGKSTMARLYAAFSWIEKSFRRGNLSRKEFTNVRFRSILGYVQIDDYLSDDTVLSYEGESLIVEYQGNNVQVRQRRPKDFLLPKILYIPSERSYLCMSDEILSISNLPSVLYELSADYFNARNIIGSDGFDLPVNGFHFEYSAEDFSSIITDDNENYSIRLNRAASGIQSVLPLSIVYAYYLNVLQYRSRKGRSILSVQQKERIQSIMEALPADIKYTEDDFMKNILDAADIRRIPKDKGLWEKGRKEILCVLDTRLSAIIEEPEQNLFPLAQKDLVEYLVRGAKSGDNSLLLTTHSPYVLAALNNLIYAGENNTTEEINKVIEKDIQIKFEDVAAYYFEKGGSISILDEDLRNIDPQKIDSCSAEINEIYEELEDIVYGLKK